MSPFDTVLAINNPSPLGGPALRHQSPSHFLRGPEGEGGFREAQMAKYTVGDKVVVNLNGNPGVGVVAAVHKDYAWTGDIWYAVNGVMATGEPFTTITRRVTHHVDSTLIAR